MSSKLLFFYGQNARSGLNSVGFEISAKDHCVGPVRKNLGYFWVQEELTRQGYRLLDMKLVATLA